MQDYGLIFSELMNKPQMLHTSQHEKNNVKSYLFVLFLCLLQPSWVSAEVNSQGPLDFELFSIQNGKAIRLCELPPKITLVNFWRADCPPCVKELPMLIDTTSRLNVRLITISVQTLSETKSLWQVVPGKQNQHIALLAPTNPMGILRRFGNQSGATPHSVVLNGNNKVCTKHSGEIDDKWIKAAILKCTSQ